jgi:O-methyltransferase
MQGTGRIQLAPPRRARKHAVMRLILKAVYVLSVPYSVVAIMASDQIHPAYRMTWPRRLWLGLRMFLNTLRVPTATTYKAHLAMAVKILETPPDVAGDIVECGTWKGGTAVNLSLVCRITGRQLVVFDSFEGLPVPEAGDRRGEDYRPGDFSGSLREVRENIQRHGALERCEFIRGWFRDTLPHLDRPVILAYLDVDFEKSLEQCVRYIWPRLADQGYIFIDEFGDLDYCALFYSERYWRERFHRTPPGLVGAGLGLAMGEFFIGPFEDLDTHPLQHANAAAYTRKDFSAYWPERSDAEADGPLD